MLVPAVGVREFLDFWLGLEGLEAFDVGLRGGVTFLGLLASKLAFAVEGERECKERVLYQRCARALWKYSLDGVLSRLINTDQYSLIRQTK